jgi:hypothetical protein
MHTPRWPFPLMPTEVLEGTDAIHTALRAYEEQDDHWIPITPQFATELLDEGETARVELGVALIPQTRRWDDNSICYCVLQADQHRWRTHGLLRIMTFTEFLDWAHQWVSHRPT